MDKGIFNKIKKKVFITIFLLLVALLVVAIYRLWMDGYFLAHWMNQVEMCDIDGDGMPEKVIVQNRRLKIEKDGGILYSSDPDWKIVNCLITDVDGDQVPEILMFLWKRGSFEKYHPFWEEDNDEYSQHIFIYHWLDEEMKPVWKSSKLIPQIKEWKLLAENKFYILTDQEEETIWTYGDWGLIRIE